MVFGTVSCMFCIGWTLCIAAPSLYCQENLRSCLRIYDILTAFKCVQHIARLFRLPVGLSIESKPFCNNERRCNGMQNVSAINKTDVGVYDQTNKQTKVPRTLPLTHTRSRMCMRAFHIINIYNIDNL